MENWQIVLLVLVSLIGIPIMFHIFNFYKRPIINDTVEILETWKERHDGEKSCYLLLDIMNPRITKKTTVDKQLFHRYKRGQKIPISYKSGRLSHSISIVGQGIPQIE